MFWSVSQQPVWAFSVTTRFPWITLSLNRRNHGEIRLFIWGWSGRRTRQHERRSGRQRCGPCRDDNAGLPVPPGFTIATSACRVYFENGNQLPDAIRQEVDQALARLEQLLGQRLGDAESPLLVSVRSGAKFSMPGMMDTILNLGMNDTVAEAIARKTG